jgi:hypothetical protein
LHYKHRKEEEVNDIRAAMAGEKNIGEVVLVTGKPF